VARVNNGNALVTACQVPSYSDLRRFELTVTPRDKHCAKNSQDRCATDVQTIKELAAPETSTQWAYIPLGGFIESLQQLDVEPTDAREYFVKERK
jgi:hypothetical protein